MYCRSTEPIQLKRSFFAIVITLIGNITTIILLGVKLDVKLAWRT
jgi:hypothetical protein